LGNRYSKVLKCNDVGVKSTTIAEVIFWWVDVKNVILINEVLNCEEAATKWSDQRCNLREDTDSTVDDLGESNVISHIEVP
jgi:hypothetical protein